MKVLVANLGSTSFKYRLFDMATERQLAQGGVERIGDPQSATFLQTEKGRHEEDCFVADHAAALERSLEQLANEQYGCLESPRDVSAIGFKAVHGGRISGVHRVNQEVLAAMEEMAEVAPAHNPPYIQAMRLLGEKLPQIPLVAAFETGFHQTIEPRQGLYAVPQQWAEAHQIRRWGFHGASHRYIAQRMAELTGRTNLRIVSCHLGGSSSLCAIRNGKSVATTMGMSPQSGLPQNNRAGDFDVYGLYHLMKKTGKSIEQLLDELATQSGLLGLSGTSGDVRDLESAASTGDRQAQLALDLFTTAIRNSLGGLLVELAGADAIVFTGGIGQNSPTLRKAVCHNLDWLGILLDDELNEQTREEAAVNQPTSQTEIWVVPTNEELVVARQTRELLEG